MDTNLVPVIEVIDGRITDNLEALHQKVERIAEEHRGIVVTDVPAARKILADLRGLFKKINAEKIAAKKVYMAPFEAIEAKVKEFGEMLNGPINEIDQQVKEAEERIRHERANAIEAIYADEYRDRDMSEAMVNQFITAPWRIDDAWMSQAYWTPKGNPAGKLKEEIARKVSTFKGGMATIQEVGGEFVAELVDDFTRHGDLSTTLASLEERRKVKERYEAMKPVSPPPAEEYPDVTPFDGPPQGFPSEAVGWDDTPVGGAPVTGEIPDFMKSQVLIKVLYSTDAELAKVRSALTLAKVKWEIVG